jgi:hypothetical protein
MGEICSTHGVSELHDSQSREKIKYGHESLGTLNQK